LDDVLMTLISQFASQMTIPPPELLLELLLLELLLLELLEVLLELLLLELVLLELLVELLLELLELLLEELLLELPVATVVPAMTVGTVGMPEAGSFDALTGMLPALPVAPVRLSRSAEFRLPSPVTSIGVAPRREPVIGSRSKMKPDPPSSQEMFDGMSVANTSLPVDRNGRSFTRSPVPVFDQVVPHPGCGVQVSAEFGKSRYQPRCGITANVPETSGPGEVAATFMSTTVSLRFAVP